MDVFSKEDRRAAWRFAVMILMLWNNRNNFIWNDERDGFVQLGILVFHTWQDWFKVQKDHSNDNGGNQHH